MKKQKVIMASTTALAAFGLFAPVINLAGTVYAVSNSAATSPAVVAFTIASTPGTVNPTNPTSPTTPTTPGTVTNPTITNPTTPNGLTLDYVPALNFGTHEVSATNQTYNAYALDVNGSGVNQYVQVFDGRALSNGAWSLAVSQEGQFGTAGANTGTLLKGAVITLSGGVIGGDNAGITTYAPATVTLTSNETGTIGADTSGGYTVNGFTGAPSGNQSHVFASTTDTSGNELGHGVNLYSFGGTAFAGTMTSTSTGNGVLTGATGITPSLVTSTGTNNGHDAQYNTVNTLTPGYNANAQLSVPGNAATPAAYSTTLDWTLYDTPDFS